VVVTNAGSDEVSLFAEREHGLELVATVASGGSARRRAWPFTGTSPTCSTTAASRT
jgi:hypothetical protein